MKAYSMDLRLRVLADCDADMGTSAVAEKYDVSPAWVRRLMQRRRDFGEIAARPRGKRKHKVDRDALTKCVHEQPDATLEELRDALGLTCSLSTIHYALRALKLTFKKNGAGRGTRSARRRRTPRDVASPVDRPESE